MFDSNHLSRLANPCSVRGVLAAAVLGLSGLLAVASPAARAALGGSPMATPEGGSTSASAPATATMRNAVTNGASGMQGAQGASASAPVPSFTVRQTVLATGTVVREYVAADGVVFGVAWRGPDMPPLETIFGSSYFQQYVAGAKAARAARGTARGPSVVEQNGLVVHSGGHMGAFVGSAWVPQALPAGVSGADIQ
ncbi:MAG TPA: DUF2844 domain-containing protein [Paraburkholderia sp.]|jgi:hypothetical protein